MESNVKKVKNIIHIICLGVGLIFWGVMFNFVCVYCHKFTAFSQFVDSTAAGFLITMFILVIGICTSEELERQTEMTVGYMGGIFYTLSAIFLGLEYDHLGSGDEIRMIFAIILAIGLAIAYFFEAIYATIKKEQLDAEV